ncbi:MAG: hypothetical protein GY771_03225, partial [bacterium]|nr:hypothetical protein [bacterium]
FLPEIAKIFIDDFEFKYWVAVESEIRERKREIPTSHAAFLILTNGKKRFNIKRTRFSHQKCSFCGRPLKDWGGKSHLMHPEGSVISDVWRFISIKNNYNELSDFVINKIFEMIEFYPQKPESSDQKNLIKNNKEEIKGLIIPREGVTSFNDKRAGLQKKGLSLHSGVGCSVNPRVNRVPKDYLNSIFQGDIVETLKKIPDNSVDMVFADPPYNLEKAYNTYEDVREKEDYIKWCNSWLAEYVRVMKPTGSLFVLNIPYWSIYHADYLNRHLSFRNWIVWDALAEPRGKLLPAHYSLLYYTKQTTGFTLNYKDISAIDATYFCRRKTCMNKRKVEGVDDKSKLTDIWWDIHRIRHTKYRDYHPCQLPDKLLERIILLSTNEDDIVLDGFLGVGTTIVNAFRLNRRYIGIDIDDYYIDVAKNKIEELKENGGLTRKSIKKEKYDYSKKELQLELRDLAKKLGRLPTPDDVRKMSTYDIEYFFTSFPTWGKALKAAKLEVDL